mgnify:FL=1
MHIFITTDSRIRVHYTDSAREALDLANKSYERLEEEEEERHKLTILINQRDAERAQLLRQEQERAEFNEKHGRRKDEGDQIVQMMSPATTKSDR